MEPSEALGGWGRARPSPKEPQTVCTVPGRRQVLFSTWSKRNLQESQAQFPDQVAPARSHLCFFEGNRFKGRNKTKHLEWGETYFQTFLAELPRSWVPLQRLHFRGRSHFPAFALPGPIAPQSRFSRSSAPCPGSVGASAAYGGYRSPALAGRSTRVTRSLKPLDSAFAWMGKKEWREWTEGLLTPDASKDRTSQLWNPQSCPRRRPAPLWHCGHGGVNSTPKCLH